MEICQPSPSGIYFAEDLNRLRNHIMFSVEKLSMLHTIAQGAMGQPIPSGRISLYNMIDEETLEKIAESTGTRLWHGFVTFGSASAGVLAIILIVRLAKLVIDSVIRGYILHSLYGWSLHLLGDIWSSITHLFLYIGTRRDIRRHSPEDQQTTETKMRPLAPPSDPGEKCISEMHNENSIAEKALKADYGQLNKYLYILESRSRDNNQ